MAKTEIIKLSQEDIISEWIYLNEVRVMLIDWESKLFMCIILPSTRGMKIFNIKCTETEEVK